MDGRPIHEATPTTMILCLPFSWSTTPLVSTGGGGGGDGKGSFVVVIVVVVVVEVVCHRGAFDDTFLVSDVRSNHGSFVRD